MPRQLNANPSICRTGMPQPNSITARSGSRGLQPGTADKNNRILELESEIAKLETTLARGAQTLKTVHRDLKEHHNNVLVELKLLQTENAKLEAENRCLKDDNDYRQDNDTELNDGGRSYAPPKRHGILNKREKTTCICGENFLTKKEMEKHLRVKVRGQFVCDFRGCKERFASDTDAIKHKRVKHNEYKPYLCRGCRRWFGTMEQLKSHRLQSKCRSKRILTGYGAESIREPDEDFELSTMAFING